MKKLLFSVTATDCKWDFYKGTGSGGQKKNKTENCCRCTHIASGAVAYSEEGRSKEHNKKNAFKKMAETPIFKAWINSEISKRSGEHDTVEKIVEQKMIDSIVLTENEEGKWVQNFQLEISPQDLKNLKNESN